MENTLAEETQNPPRRRRRTHRKSAKTSYQQRRRWKTIGMWLLAGLIGGVAVAAIAIMAGQSSG
jgi:hypothetical protein